MPGPDDISAGPSAAPASDPTQGQAAQQQAAPQPAAFTPASALSAFERWTIDRAKNAVYSLQAHLVSSLMADLEKLDSIDKRWLAIAKTDIEKGFMALERAIKDHL